MMKHFSQFNFKTIKKGKKTKRGFNSTDIFTFDIETTSFMASRKTCIAEPIVKTLKKKKKDHNGDIIRHKIDTENYTLGSYCYIWMFSHNNQVYYGRNIDDYKAFVNDLNYYLSQNCINIEVYCHNLSFEFQHIHRLFNFTNVKARKMRKVLSAQDQNITYKCSYVLAACSLEKCTGKFNLPINKKAGDLDYTKLRHSNTILTQEELDYCEYDCLVLYEYIKYEKEQIKTKGRSKFIPMTATGKVRNLVKDAFRDVYKGLEDRKEKVAKLTPSPELYKLLKAAFRGGYTHANHYNVNQVFNNVLSYDLKSDYPSQMFVNKFPDGEFVKIAPFTEYDELKAITNDDDYAYLIDIRFKELESINDNNYISISQSTEITGWTNHEIITGKEKYLDYDNGRVCYADVLRTVITEQDLAIILDNYVFTDFEIIEIQQSKKEYLPIEILKLIESLFKEKERLSTILNSLNEDEAEYIAIEAQLKQVKEFINSLYGMSVTNYISDVIHYSTLTNDENKNWTKDPLTDIMIKEQLDQLKEDQTLILPYQMGVWVTAYARRSLWALITGIDNDVIYCDTDSVKFKNIDKHEHLFHEYNDVIIAKNKAQCQRFNLDESILYNLGVFALDGVYQEFKTLGAKKYAYRDKKGLHITVSGVPKKGVECLEDDIQNFRPGFRFDDRSGKKASYYIDEAVCAYMTDENGNSDLVTSLSGMCLYNESYTLSLSRDFFYHLQLINQTKRS